MIVYIPLVGSLGVETCQVETMSCFSAIVICNADTQSIERGKYTHARSNNSSTNTRGKDTQLVRTRRDGAGSHVADIRVESFAGPPTSPSAPGEVDVNAATTAADYVAARTWWAILLRSLRPVLLLLSLHGRSALGLFGDGVASPYSSSGYSGHGRL